MGLGTLLSNFRKILDINFFLFILSLLLFAEIFQNFFAEDKDLFKLFIKIDFLIPFILSYLFLIVILTPMTKYIALFLSILRFFKPIDKIFEFFQNEDKDKSRDEYITLSELREQAIIHNNETLYSYYLEKKEEFESMQFTSKFSYVVLVLSVLDYFFAKNSYVNIFLNIDNILVNLIIGLPYLALLLMSITYFQHDDRIIDKKITKNLTKQSSE